MVTLLYRRLTARPGEKQRADIHTMRGGLHIPEDLLVLGSLPQDESLHSEML